MAAGEAVGAGIAGRAKVPNEGVAGAASGVLSAVLLGAEMAGGTAGFAGLAGRGMAGAASGGWVRTARASSAALAGVAAGKRAWPETVTSPRKSANVAGPMPGTFCN